MGEEEEESVHTDLIPQRPDTQHCERPHRSAGRQTSTLQKVSSLRKEYKLASNSKDAVFLGCLV